MTDIDHGGDGEALADAIVRLCGVLGLAVIAEGVETTDEARDLGVLAAQGFLFAEPQAPPAMDARFRDRPHAIVSASPPQRGRGCWCIRPQSDIKPPAAWTAADRGRVDERLVGPGS